jgi:BRCA1-associated protein
MPSTSICNSCSSTTNLWICLICGNIGCGRYGRAHAHAHYESTTHLYALELETQRVWDYAADIYVHRLIQNKADGKLVELPSSSMGVSGREGGGGGGPTPADAIAAEKNEAIGIEYSYLLTSQLDSQREYYEEQTSALQLQVAELSTIVDRLGREMEKEQNSAKENEAKMRREEDERIERLERDRKKAEKKAEKVAELARKLEKELREERAVGEGLLKNIGKMKEKVELADKEKAEHDAKVRELEDQLRDVMFFLEAKEKIEKGEGVVGEAAGGSVELPLTPSTPTSGTGKKRAKKG